MFARNSYAIAFPASQTTDDGMLQVVPSRPAPCAPPQDTSPGVGALDFSSGSAFIQSLFSNPLYLLGLGGLGWLAYSKLTAAHEKTQARKKKAAIDELDQAYAAERQSIEEQYPGRRRKR